MEAAAAPIGPTRAHWISDAKTTHCAEPGCGKLFDMFRTRRHHCRRCGLVFCLAHSSHRMRLGPDARPSESGELSRVCARCLTAADDTHTAADVTKIGKMADPASRWAQVTRLPTSSLLQLHVAGHVVSRSRTAFFKAKRAQVNAHESARVEATVRAYAALGGTAAERAAAGVLDLPKNSDRALAAAVACGMPECRKPLSARVGRHRCKICATVVCSSCSSKKSWALPPSAAPASHRAGPPAGIPPGQPTGGGRESDRGGGAGVGGSGGGVGGGAGEVGSGMTNPSPSDDGSRDDNAMAADETLGMDLMGPAARVCANCSLLLERHAVARRVSAMRAAAAASPLASSYAQMWATTATLRAEAHALETAMLRLPPPAAATAPGTERSSAPAVPGAPLPPSVSPSTTPIATPPPPPPAAPPAPPLPSVSVLHEACRSVRAVESLLPSVLALLKTFGATPLEFEAEARAKAAAMRAPAELIKLVMPRFHAHKRVLQRHAENLGMSVEEVAGMAPKQVEARMRARQGAGGQWVGGSATAGQGRSPGVGGGRGEAYAPAASGEGLSPAEPHLLGGDEGADADTGGEYAEDTEGGQHASGPHADTEAGYASAPPPTQRSVTAPRGSVLGGARAGAGWGSVRGSVRASYAASMVGAAAAYVGATAAYAVGAAAPADIGYASSRASAAGGAGVGEPLAVSLQEYLVARRTFIELQRGLQLYSPEVGKLADSAKAVHGSVLKLMQEELEVRATQLGLDLNAQLIELTHAITAPRAADNNPFFALRPPDAPDTAGPHSLDKGAMLSKLLGVATRALADLEEEVSPMAFRPARQALATLKALLRDVYVAECIPY